MITERGNFLNTIGFNNTVVESKEVNPWKQDYSSNSTIFGINTYLPIDFNQALNDNTLVVGTSGTGKTYSFVEPNVLQGNANYIVADAKGNILEDVGESLKNMGYKISVLNLIDLEHSMSYNPLKHINTPLEARAFAEQILATTTNGVQKQNNISDPFWDKAAATLITSLILFVKEFLPENEQNISAINFIFNCLQENITNIDKVLHSLNPQDTSKYYPKYELYRTNEIDYDYDYNQESENPQLNIGNLLFENAQLQNPNSYAVKIWNSIINTAYSEKTWGSVLAIAGASLSSYTDKNIEHLLDGNQIDFSDLINEKTAFFILYDDADPSKNFISNIFYFQLFKYLYHQAFTYPNKSLPYKIRFFLDDFKNINIPNFDDYLATARSRNISICMMLQDESQLKAKFLRNYSSVIGNCSAYLLTGTTNLTMAETAAKRFNCDAQKIRLMCNDSFLVDIGGHITKTKRYNFHQHPNFIDKKYNINSYNIVQQNKIFPKKLFTILKKNTTMIDPQKDLFAEKRNEIRAKIRNSWNNN